MPNQSRSYPLLSACGLNCGLCPRHHTDGSSRCPGCGGAGFSEKRPSCGIISCCARHGVEYCFLCGEYPCKKLQGAECVDSFITHRNMRVDFEKAKTDGLESYQAMLNEKVDLLAHLLANYNDGRKKSFYCLGVNLLPLEDTKQVLAKLKAETPQSADPKEKAAAATRLFEEKAAARGIELKLNKKKTKQ